MLTVAGSDDAPHQRPRLAHRPKSCDQLRRSAVRRHVLGVVPFGLVGGFRRQGSERSTDALTMRIAVGFFDAIVAARL
jgi:hypothetical protein